MKRLSAPHIFRHMCQKMPVLLCHYSILTRAEAKEMERNIYHRGPEVQAQGECARKCVFGLDGRVVCRGLMHPSGQVREWALREAA